MCLSNTIVESLSHRLDLECHNVLKTRESTKTPQKVGESEDSMGGRGGGIVFVVSPVICVA